MKLLLTSAGVINPSLRAALIDLLGKPVEECSALFVPTGSYGHRGGIMRAAKHVAGREPRTPMAEIGWKEVGLLELTVLPHIPRDYWVPYVEQVDALLVSGGDPLFLNHWMRESGLAGVFPSLTDTVYVGFSAGAMVMAPRVGEDFVGWRPPTGSDETLGVVDFAMFPHLDHPDLPENTMADAEKWAEGMDIPCFAIDDQTGIVVRDGAVQVVSEGFWRQLR